MKIKGLFINTEKAECSIFESGFMAYQLLKKSKSFMLDYIEVSETQRDIPLGYDFYVFNYHYATMSWLDCHSVQILPGIKITLILETLPNDPFVLCPSNAFDVHCPLEPSIKIDNPSVYPLPRPLEVASNIPEYEPKEIPVIGSFGFATPGKGFELVVDAVNKEFDRAVVRINMPPSAHADAATWGMHKTNYAKYIAENCKKIAKKGIEVDVTYEFMDKAELINWCAQNTLNCFLYDRDSPGLAATTDQAISSGRPLAVSANQTFRHIHTYLTPYPTRSLKSSIKTSTSDVIKMQQAWSPDMFVATFESMLEKERMLKTKETITLKALFDLNQSETSPSNTLSPLKAINSNLEHQLFKIHNSNLWKAAGIYYKTRDIFKLKKVINRMLPLATSRRYYAKKLYYSMEHNLKKINKLGYVIKDNIPKASDKNIITNTAPKKRILWIGAHKLLVRTELPRLRELGFEVFNPPYLSGIKDQSAEMNWDQEQKTTLPRKIFKKLANYNFFYNEITPEMEELINHYFDAIIVTCSPEFLKHLIGIFKKKLIFRTYGQHYLMSDDHYGLHHYKEEIQSHPNFTYMPFCIESMENEAAWLKDLSVIVPYCIQNDIIKHKDTWVRKAARTEVALTCPKIDNAYYQEHYQFLKENFNNKMYRFYGVQTASIKDSQVVGKLEREEQLDCFRLSVAYIYTYTDNVCYLPPIEMMIIGVPVLFLDGSLLSKFFPADAPGRCQSVDEAKHKIQLILHSDEYRNKILESQIDVRKRYFPENVWPSFDDTFKDLLG